MRFQAMKRVSGGRLKWVDVKLKGLRLEYLTPAVTFRYEVASVKSGEHFLVSGRHRIRALDAEAEDKLTAMQAEAMLSGDRNQVWLA